MKLLINAINLKSAGGLTVALNFINCLKEHDLGFSHITIIAPNISEYTQFRSENIKVITFENTTQNYLKRLYLDYFKLPQIAKQEDPDVIYTMGNWALPIVNKPQGLFFAWPYAVYPDEKSIWQAMSLKDRVTRKLRLKAFESRLKYADIIFPQTYTVKNRLEKYYTNKIKKTIVVPMGFNRIENTEFTNSKDSHFFEKAENSIYLLCLARYYQHKNLEIFIPLAKLIKCRRLPYKIIISIEANQHANAKMIIEQINTHELNDILINIGTIRLNEVSALYNQVDGMILPTLLESFSATYVDSMKYEKPIFTSKLDFAEDACGDCAFYFDPHSVENIINTLNSAYREPKKLAMKVTLGKERLACMPAWPQIAKIYTTGLQGITNNDDAVKG